MSTTSDLSDLSEENFDSKLDDSLVNVTERGVHLVSVVEGLGQLLTDVAVGKRKLGLSFLSKFLSLLKPNFLNEDECKFLGQFYRDRMRDHHSLIPDVITGIDVLLRMDNFKGEHLISLLSASFNEIHAQSHVLEDRSRIFAYHQFLLHNKLDQILPMGMDYLLGFIQAVDEEKDPNNLMVIFTVWPIIINNFELEPLVEDTFETMACYFPIDFTPPGGVYGTVTREKLISALRKCLTFPVFAPKAIPLFLEKLDSDLIDAKIDSATSLSECLTSCSPDHAGLFLGQIWSAIKMEILGVRAHTNEQVVQACLHVLKSATRRLATVVQTPENRELLTKWLEQIWSDCGRHLKDIELKFMKSSVDIFSAVVGSGADFPSIYVLERSMPVLIDLYHSKKNDVTGCVSVLNFTSALLRDAPEPVLTPDWYEKFLFVCNLGLSTENEPSLEAAACRTLTSAIKFLTVEHAEQIFSVQMEKVCAGKIPVPEMVELIESLASKTSRPTESDLYRLFEILPQHSDAVLPWLKALSRNSNHLPKILDRILTVFSSKTPAKENQSEILWALQLCQEVWDHHKNLDHFLSPDQHIFDLAYSKVLTIQNPRNYEIESRFRDLISKILSNVTEEQVPWIEMTFMTTYMNKLGFEAAFDYMETFVCSIRSQIFSRLHHDAVMRFYGICPSRGCFDVINPLAKIRGAVVNKRDDPDHFINRGLDYYPICAEDTVPYLGWLLRGLLLRNHPRLPEVVDRIVNRYLRVTDEPGEPADKMAKMFAYAVSNQPDFMEVNPVLAGLARQKVFILSKPDLIESYNEGINPTANLKALICQLEYLPKFALAAEITSLVPLLSKGLSSESDDELVITTLTSLRDICKQDPEEFGKILGTFLPIWVGLATNRKRTMEIRIEALKCIKASSKTNQQEVVKLKRDVMRQLLPALDDHKRLVRKEAVLARNAWALAS